MRRSRAAATLGPRGGARSPCRCAGRSPPSRSSAAGATRRAGRQAGAGPRRAPEQPHARRHPVAGAQLGEIGQVVPAEKQAAATGRQFCGSSLDECLVEPLAGDAGVVADARWPLTSSKATGTGCSAYRRSASCSYGVEDCHATDTGTRRALAGNHPPRRRLLERALAHRGGRPGRESSGSSTVRP